MDLSIVQKRGEAVESIHPISAILCNPSGEIVKQIGPPVVTTWRSAAKPFQLEATVGLLPTILQDSLQSEDPVSYTHLTLPTNREV